MAQHIADLKTIEHMEMILILATKPAAKQEKHIVRKPNYWIGGSDCLTLAAAAALTSMGKCKYCK